MSKDSALSRVMGQIEKASFPDSISPFVMSEVLREIIHITHKFSLHKNSSNSTSYLEVGDWVSGSLNNNTFIIAKYLGGDENEIGSFNISQAKIEDNGELIYIIGSGLTAEVDLLPGESNNCLEVYESGILATPKVSVDMLLAEGLSKALVTKEYLNRVVSDSIGDISIDAYTKTEIDNKLENLDTEAKYSGSPNPTISLGGLDTNYVLTGKSALEILEDLLVVYQIPYFNSFTISSYSRFVEVGTTLSGPSTFSWNISNGINVSPNSISIIDSADGDSIISNASLPTQGSISAPYLNVKLNAKGENRNWKISGENTKGAIFIGNIDSTAYYNMYYGSSPIPITSSNEVRSLPNSSLLTSNSSTFILNTGSSDLRFVVAVPQDTVITSVVDLDSVSAVLTADYILYSIVNVLDAGGTPRTYNIYMMTAAIPYSVNHRHQITIGPN